MQQSPLRNKARQKAPFLAVAQKSKAAKFAKKSRRKNQVRRSRKMP
jgi:hypothetical protein